MGASSNKEQPRIDIDKNNGDDLDPEYVFPGIGTHIPDEKLELIKNQKKSICKIFIKNKEEVIDYGTGFLCNYIKNTKETKVLITAYHVLDEENLKNGNKIKISFNDNKKIKIINIEGPSIYMQVKKMILQ